MIKVMVVLYGLVMFVPQHEELTVLFVDGGSHVPDVEHTPRVETVLECGHLGDLGALKDGFEIAIQGPSGKVGDTAQTDFAKLEELFTHNTQGKVRRDCLQNDPSCKIGKDDLVRGLVRIRGEWTARPATYDNRDGWSLPIRFDDRAKFQFRRRAAGPPRDEATFPLATALRLDTVVKKDELENLLSLDHPIAAIEGQACEDWMGEDVDQCVILVIGNQPAVYADIGAHEPHPLDEHFTAFYRVTLDPPMRMNRWLPYLDASSCCAERNASRSKMTPRGVVNWPSHFCPPVYATAEP